MIPEIYRKWILPFLFVTHVAGIIGLILMPQWFKVLTPINLFVCSGLVVVGLERPSSKLVFSLLLIALFGWSIEVVGVKTEWIFGRYSYGEGLGWKFLDVPLIIGLNWAILTYSVVQIAASLYKGSSKFLIAAISASLLVLIDLAIEWPAPMLDFWSFGQYYAPLHNFIGWWLVGFALVYMFAPYLNEKKNTLAIWYYIIQLVFFLSYGLVSSFVLS
jgi:putative membrane protein